MDRNELGRHPGGGKGGKRKTRRLCFPRSGLLERNPEMEIQEISGTTCSRKWGKQDWAEGEIKMWCCSSFSLSSTTETSGAGRDLYSCPKLRQEAWTVHIHISSHQPVPGYGLSLGRGWSLGQVVCSSEGNSRRRAEPRAVHRKNELLRCIGGAWETHQSICYMW